MHALIIEDEPFIAILIEDVLLEMGFLTVEVATCLAEAVAASERVWPSLITADVDLGSTSGIDAVEAIGPFGAIPVVFVTASGNDVRQRWSGATIVAKPFSTHDLRQAVCSCVPARRGSA